MKLAIDNFRSHGSLLYTDKGVLVDPLFYNVQKENVSFVVGHELDESDENSIITIDVTLFNLVLDNGMYINVKANDFYIPVQIISVGINNKYKINGNFSEYVETDQLTILLDESVFVLENDFIDGVYFNDTKEMIVVSTRFAPLNIKPSAVYAEYPPLRNSSFDYQVQEWINKAYDSVMNMIPNKLQLSIEQSYQTLELNDIINFIIWGALEFWEATLDQPIYRFTGKSREGIKHWNPRFLTDKEDHEIQTFNKWNHW